MKVFKNNSLIIVVIGLMLVTAGYMNFIETEKENIVTSGNLEIADLGDAKLVSSTQVSENNSLETALVENEELIQENKVEEIIKEESSLEPDNYFASSKLERDTMYSQMIETYQKMLDSSVVSEEQKAIAQSEITKINKIRNAIMISENLIKTKGFEDVVILENEKSINVILKKEEIKQEDIAQIQNIVSRELEANVENIHISNK